MSQRTVGAGLVLLAAVGIFLLIGVSPTLAQEAAPAQAGTIPQVSVFIFNTFWFLVGGMFVVLMAAGFTMLEAGFVHEDSVGSICIKNFLTYGAACTMYFLVGYELMYPGDNWIVPGYLGTPGLVGIDPVGVAESSVDLTYAATAADAFFQMVFVATPAAIVSGALAERAKILPYLALIAVQTGFIYPIASSWQWGGGWLSEGGFLDFAGGAVVHAAGGSVALAAAIVVGPRDERFVGGKVGRIKMSSIPISTIGLFMLWIGFFGFNGGSQLALGSVGDVSDVARILLNTNLAGAGGMLVGLLISQIVYRRPDASLVLNGALGGLVSITAEPLAPSLIAALVVGGTGGLVVFLVRGLLEWLKIDDVVGAIPVHLGCGALAALVVPFANPAASFAGQAFGLACIAGFSFAAALATCLVLNAIFGMRTPLAVEREGLDKSEVRTIH